jgi:hypothetical protein
MKHMSKLCYIVLIILVLSVYLPMIYEKIALKPVEKTHLFYSPVSRDFIYKETRVGDIPEEALNFAEDHHTGIVYRKADGAYLSRVDFEKHLPFIFYKNMEIWGLLPLYLNGRKFDKSTIQKSRQVMELSTRNIPDKTPHAGFYPLLESNPGQARLVFPEDRFRMTDTAMVFVNADTNTVDRELTRTFTRALQNQGFVFPARSVNGKFTVLKPFDEGVFLVDSDYRVFHVKRVDQEPRVVRTGIPAALKTRYINVSENSGKIFYGLLLAGDGTIHLLSYDNYTLVPILLEHYDPDRMDLKLIFNPLYVTAVYSDAATIRAVAMDRQFQPLASYTHAMSRATPTLAFRIHQFLFPFSLKPGTTETDDYFRFHPALGDLSSLAGMVLCILIYGGFTFLHRKRKSLCSTP